jgi:hypothetical protein
MSRGNRDTISTGTTVKAVSGAGTTRANRDASPDASGLTTADPNERRDIPTENSPNFMGKIREALSVYLGKRGDPLDRGITVRDLEAAGIITVGDGYLSNPGGFRPIGGIGSGVEGAYVVDLSPPPSPTGFAAAAAVSNIIVESDSPSFKQGHGYARTRLYGATYDGSTDLPLFADATLLTEFIGTVFSYPTDPATTWRLWMTWETKDGVESVIPAGGINGLQVTTAQNPAKLVEALTGQITASQLYADLNARINLIDGGTTGPRLAYPLVQIAAAQDALNQRIFQNLNSIGTDLLTNAATINTTAGLVTAAGIYVDSGTGTVKISGLEATNTYLSAVDVRLSAAESSITLKATKTYVDNLVATAVIDPTQIPVFGTLSARLDSAEVNISGLTASVSLKAASLDLTATNVRMTTAETNISSLTGSISSKVDSSTFTSVTGGLDTRLGSAETTIASLGGTSSITNLVQQSNQRLLTDNINAETLLRSILNTQAESDARASELAFARTDLTAYIDSGIAAEASSRTVLASQVADNKAALELNYYTKSGTDSAIASATTSLGSAIGVSIASVLTNYYSRASTDSAISSVSTTLSTAIGINTAAISIQAAAIDGLTAQYMVKLDVNGNVSGYGLYQDASNSKFIISTDQFAVATPASSIPAWAATTAYTAGKIAGISGNTVKMLVCKVGGTSSSGAPSIAGDIGSLVQDGSVTWQIASRVPFSIVTSSVTINGVSVAPGMYVDGALIVNATVNNAQIANLAVDDQKIASLNVSKLTAGSLTIGQYIRSAAQHVYAGVTDWDWSIDSNGLAVFNNTVVRGGVYATYGSIGGIIIDSTAIRIGQTGYNNGSGFYLGSDGRFSLGNSSGNRLTWDGTNLNIRSASSGSARMEILNDVIIVYDASGAVRVKIGNLA